MDIITLRETHIIQWTMLICTEEAQQRPYFGGVLPHKQYMVWQLIQSRMSAQHTFYHKKYLAKRIIILVVEVNAE